MISIIYLLYVTIFRYISCLYYIMIFRYIYNDIYHDVYIIYHDI